NTNAQHALCQPAQEPHCHSNSPSGRQPAVHVFDVLKRAIPVKAAIRLKPSLSQMVDRRGFGRLLEIESSECRCRRANVTQRRSESAPRPSTLLLYSSMRGLFHFGSVGSDSLASTPLVTDVRQLRLARDVRAHVIRHANTTTTWIARRQPLSPTWP